MLKTGLCDFAILENHCITREMDSKILKAERYCLYGPASWKRRLFPDIITNETIIDFNSEDNLTFAYLEKYRFINRARKERHFANNTDALISMIAAGLGYSVLTEELAQSHVNRGEIFKIAAHQFLDFKIALAWYPRPEMPDYFKAIVQSLN
jgi:DNA-binding transcriptional LysR family regulator